MLSYMRQQEEEHNSFFTYHLVQLSRMKSRHVVTLGQTAHAEAPKFDAISRIITEERAREGL